jgi:hypothetical protein
MSREGEPPFKERGKDDYLIVARCGLDFVLVLPPLDFSLHGKEVPLHQLVQLHLGEPR